jgi:hypothetical protein
MKFQIITQAALFRLTLLAIILSGIAICLWFLMIRMPGRSFEGAHIAKQNLLSKTLKRDLEKLAGEIGIRNMEHYQNLTFAAEFLEKSLGETGHKVQRQGYNVEDQICYNLEIEIKGTEKPNEIVIIGAHYDSVVECPGANDNGTGSVAVLALARSMSHKSFPRTLRFVEFVNEEPPYFQTPLMGSVVYAKRCRERNENIVAVLSLETMGYYSDEEGSQHYPSPLFKWLYPSKGNFIAFVGNVRSKKLVQTAVESFRRHGKVPSEAIATFDTIPGVGWSDHWAFWQQEYPGIMVTDTAPFRYPHYHKPTDTPDKINYERMSEVVIGLEKVIEEIASKK